MNGLQETAPPRAGRHGGSHRWLAPVRLGAAALALVGAGFWLGAWFGPKTVVAGRQKLPDYGAAPAWQLTDQTGKPVSSTAFAGKVQVVTFLFPYCTTYCPLITAHLVGFERLLQDAGAADKVSIVAFNLAPSDAGLPQMRTFLKQYGWNPADRHWEYLTGPDAQIRRVVTKGFHVAFQRVPDSERDIDAVVQTPQPVVENPLAAKVKPGYDISHNDALEIVDTHGHIRRIYDQADVLSNDALWQDVRSLLPAGARATDSG